MQEIKCPNCGKVFQVDESGYTQIVQQVRDREFARELEQRSSELTRHLEQEKQNAYKDLQRFLYEDAASVYIQDPALLTAVSKELGGYVFYPVYVQDMSLVYYIK